MADFEFVRATLLSVEEAETMLTKEERKYRNSWWLRSPGYRTYYAALVYCGGDFDYYGTSVNYSNACVRPALIFESLSDGWAIGDTFEIGIYRFKIISNHLAWLYGQDLGIYQFRDDWKAESADVYELSDVKRFVDEWFNKNIKEKEVAGI